MAASSNKQQLSNNNLMIIMVLVTLVVLGATGLISKALLTSIVRDTKVVSAKSKADKQLKDDLTAAPQLVNAFQGLGSTANTLSDALPNTSDFPGLLVLMENISNDSGLKLKAVAPGDSSQITQSSTSTGGTPSTSSTAPTASNLSSAATEGSSSASSTAGGATGGATQATPKSYDFTFDFDGTYVGLLKLLGDLQSSARPMRITGMELAGSGSVLSGTLNVQTFYQDKAQLPFSTETIK